LPTILQSALSGHRPLLWALGLAAVVALGLNAELIFDSAVQAHYADSPDSADITRRALQADGATIAAWWWGPWVQQEMYYRPLSSLLMWAQARLWGWNFQPYCILSWLIHTGNSLLVVLLLYSLCPGPRWQRALCGLLGALLFNLGHHPDGAYWSRARVAWGMMPWWPVQTDLCSAFWSLTSLLALDRFLVLERRGEGSLRRWLALAYGAFIVALLFKETPLLLIMVVPFLVSYRRRPWLALEAGFLGIGVVFYALRAIFVPEASGLEWQGTYTFYKFLNYTHLLTAELLYNGEIWEWVAIITLFPLLLGLRRLKVPARYLVVAALVWPLVIAGVVTGNPALATIPREMTILLRFAGVYAGFALALITARREPALVLIIALLATAVPNVNRIGPHYWYWPVMMWGLVNGAVLNAALNYSRRCWPVTQRWLGK
jgi:hypothetical protein